MIQTMFSFICGISIAAAYQEVGEDGSYRHIIRYVIIAIASVIGWSMCNG